MISADHTAAPTARRRVAVGDTARVRLPFSEVCMALRVAGQARHVTVLARGAQILDPDGSPYSFPVTHGEAGIRTDADGLYVPPEHQPQPTHRDGEVHRS